MNLYQLDAAIEDAISQGYERFVDEDGVLVDEEGYKEWMNHLQAAEDAKMENVALYIKNLKSEAAAIREEEKALADRRHKKEKHSEWLADYLAGFLRMKGRDKFETAKCAVRFTSSESVEVTDGDTLNRWLSDHSLMPGSSGKETRRTNGRRRRKRRSSRRRRGAASTMRYTKDIDFSHLWVGFAGGENNAYWEKDPSVEWKCSKCGGMYLQLKTRYCPWCGAKMCEELGTSLFMKAKDEK